MVECGPWTVHTGRVHTAILHSTYNCRQLHFQLTGQIRHSLVAPGHAASSCATAKRPNAAAPVRMRTVLGGRATISMLRLYGHLDSASTAHWGRKGILQQGEDRYVATGQGTEPPRSDQGRTPEPLGPTA